MNLLFSKYENISVPGFTSVKINEMCDCECIEAILQFEFTNRVMYTASVEPYDCVDLILK